MDIPWSVKRLIGNEKKELNWNYHLQSPILTLSFSSSLNRSRWWWKDDIETGKDREERQGMRLLINKMKQTQEQKKRFTAFKGFINYNEYLFLFTQLTNSYIFNLHLFSFHHHHVKHWKTLNKPRLSSTFNLNSSLTGYNRWATVSMERLHLYSCFSCWQFSSSSYLYI